MLKVLASHDPLVLEWLKQKTYKYTSHKIQNEFLDGIRCVNRYFISFTSIPFVTLMLDETTNVSNTSQAVVILKYVTDAFDVHEEFIGMYQVPSTNAETLVATAKLALKGVNLPITKLRGQCYD